MKLSASVIQQFSTVSSRNSLLILPALPAKGKKEKAGATARCVVGDDSGTVTCLSLRRGGGIELDYKYVLPAKPGGIIGRVECLALGGGVGSRERVFVSSGSTVTGLSRKGKEFFSLSTSSSDPLQTVVLDDTRLYGASEYRFAAFDGEGKDLASLTCSDKIGALTLARESSGSGREAEVLLGCQDRTLRLVGRGTVLAELVVEGVVSALVAWYPELPEETEPCGPSPPPPPTSAPSSDLKNPSSGGMLNRLFGSPASKAAAQADPVAGGGADSNSDTPTAAAGVPFQLPPSSTRFFIYGTTAGVVGCCKLQGGGEGSAGPPTLTRLWSFSTPSQCKDANSSSSSSSSSAPSSSSSPVTALYCSPILPKSTFTQYWPFPLGDGSGSGELVVGRDDGSVEVYSVGPAVWSGVSEEAVNSCAPGQSIKTAISDGAGSWASFSTVSSRGEGLFNASTSAAIATTFLREPFPRLLASFLLPEAVRCLAVLPGEELTTPPTILALAFSGRLSSISVEQSSQDDFSSPTIPLKGAQAPLDPLVSSAHSEGSSSNTTMGPSSLQARKDALKHLLGEVGDLKKQVAAASAALEATAVAAAAAPAVMDSGTALVLGNSMYPMQHRLEVNSSWTLDPVDVVCNFTVELPCPIESVLISSTVLLEGPDPGTQELASIPSPPGAGSILGQVWGQRAQTPPVPFPRTSPPPSAPIIFSSLPLLNLVDSFRELGVGIPDSSKAPSFLATLRCGDVGEGRGAAGGGGGAGGDSKAEHLEGASAISSQRFTVRFRPLEGMAGEIHAAVSAASYPPTAVSLRIPIKPLSLHTIYAGTPASVEALLNSQWTEYLQYGGRVGGQSALGVFGGSGGGPEPRNNGGGSANGSRRSSVGDSLASQGSFELIESENLSGTGESKMESGGSYAPQTIAHTVSGSSSNSSGPGDGGVAGMLSSAASASLEAVHSSFTSQGCPGGDSRSTGGRGGKSTPTYLKGLSGPLGPPPPSPLDLLPSFSPLLPANFPLSSLVVLGDFSLSLVHDWVSAALPDVSQHPQTLKGMGAAAPCTLLAAASAAAASAQRGRGAGGLVGGGGSTAFKDLEQAVLTNEAVGNVWYNCSLGSHLFLTYVRPFFCPEEVLSTAAHKQALAHARATKPTAASPPPPPFFYLPPPRTFPHNNERSAKVFFQLAAIPLQPSQFYQSIWCSAPQPPGKESLQPPLAFTLPRYVKYSRFYTPAFFTSTIFPPLPP